MNIFRRLIAAARQDDVQQQELQIHVVKSQTRVNDYAEKLTQVLSKYAAASKRLDGVDDREAAANAFLCVCGWMLTVEPRFTIAELQDIVNVEIPKVLLALKVPEK